MLQLVYSTGGPDRIVFYNGRSVVLRGDRRLVEHSYVNGLRSMVDGYLSSLPDTSVSRAVTGRTMYYDTNRGNDANSGLSPALPKATLPAYPENGQHDSKVLVAAGSTIVRDVAAGGLAITPVNNKCTISVYDGDSSSPTYGHETLDQPNYRLRAQLGLALPSKKELAKKHYFVDMRTTGYSLGSQSLSVGSAFNTSSCPDLLVRGAVIEDCVTGLYCNAGASLSDRYIRFEDSIILKAQTDPTTNTSRFGGVGVRGDGSTNCSPNFSGARLHIEGCGEDVFWFGRKTVLSGGFSLSDFVLVHSGSQIKYNVQHADVWQFSERPGPFTIRRGIVYHRLPDAPLIDTGDGVLSVGGCLVTVGATSGYGDATGTGGLIEDVEFVTNNQLLNNSQPGLVMRRCIGVMNSSRPNLSQGYATGVSALLVQRYAGTTMTEDRCLWSINRPQAQAVAIRASISGAPVSTQVNVTDIPYVSGP